jgi:hypothetical protein
MSDSEKDNQDSQGLSVNRRRGLKKYLGIFEEPEYNTNIGNAKKFFEDRLTAEKEELASVRRWRTAIILLAI